MAAFGAYLHRLTGVNDVVIGLPIIRRPGSKRRFVPGMFANVLPIRLHIDGGSDVKTLALHASDVLDGALNHYGYRFETLCRELNLKGGAGRWMSATINILSYEYDVRFGDARGTGHNLSTGPVDDIALSFYEHNDDRLRIDFDATLSRYDVSEISVHQQRFLRFVRNIVAKPPCIVSAIEILGDDERKLLQVWNQTETPYSGELCIHELFEQQVERNPGTVAVEQGEVYLSYAQLNTLANQLAHKLIERGVKPDAPVALCSERRPHLVLALLAILKAGGAYVPLDPTYPAERLRDLLEDAQPVLLLSDAAGRSALGEQQINLPHLALDDSLSLEKDSENSNPDPKALGLTSSHLAYVIYTSGSTGKPKGALNEHRAIVNRLHWMQQAYALTPADVVLQKTPFSFDVSVWEFFWTLLNGAKLVLAQPQAHKDPKALIELITSAQVSTLHFVPSMLNSFLATSRVESCTSLRRIVCSGEALAPDSVRQCQRLLPKSRLYNLYGPTEAAVDVTAWSCPKDFDGSVVPIGRPIANTQIYILDSQGQPVPLGAIGELYIGGAGVARGYLNRPELTRERFLPDPFFGRDELPTTQGLRRGQGQGVSQSISEGAPKRSDGGLGIRESRGKQVSDRTADEQELIPTGARMYRTGDLARYLPDGNIEFLGRNDSQVKLRGFRIELGEIESRMRQCAGVKEAAVIAREDVPGDKRLVAYFATSASQEQEPEAEPAEQQDRSALISGLRAELATHLPDYMVPSAFVHLDALPLTVSGKLDRKALPAPDASALLQHTYRAPEGHIEQALAAIWAELLGVERVGRNDHFFELGGHSLLAIELMKRVRRLGLSLEVRDLFMAPTLAALSGALKKESAIPVPANLITKETPRITPELLPLAKLEQSEIDRIVQRFSLANIQDIYALTPLQEGILFHHLLATQGDPYLSIVQMAFSQRSMVERYIAAIQKVIDRHDILRTAFVWEGLRAPAQVVLRTAKLEITEIQLEAHESAEQLAQRFDPRHHRLDLTQAPLLRVVIAQEPYSVDKAMEDTSTNRWLVVFLLHHLIGDLSTLQLLHDEVLALLEDRSQQLGPALPFRDLVAQARLGLSPEEHETFFSSLLADIDEPTIPFGLSDVHLDGSRIVEAHLPLSASLNNRLRFQARRLGVSLASLCHLAWAAVVGATSSRRQVVFGTVLFGRAQGAGLDRAIGLFINTLPIRLDLDRTPIKEAVLRTHRLLAELLNHEHAPLALAQRTSALASGVPLFNALLNYRHSSPDNTVAFQSNGQEQPFQVEWLHGQERTNYPLTLSVEDGGSGLGLAAQVSQPIAPLRVCEFMQQALEELVGKLESDPETPVCELNILPPAEREILLEGWNSTQAIFPAQSCIHELFEQQVERTPGATAVVQGETSFTYAQLNSLANQLAHKLIERGVQPDTPVALCSERRPHLVVALLAILKAGGAYVLSIQLILLNV
jgi:amino acid adenylation domain-containing protein